MRYRIYLAALVMACAAVTIGFPVASADQTPPVGEHDNGLSICEEQYLATYAEAHAKLGAEAVGANLVDDGTGPHAAYSLPEALCEQKVAVLDGMLNPPEPVVAETVESAPIEASSGGYSIPESIVMCESGGDYSASNPSGAYGAYQIMPGTASAYGCDLSTAAGQDACAAEIYADVGSSAWVCG